MREGSGESIFQHLHSPSSTGRRCLQHGAARACKLQEEATAGPANAAPLACLAVRAVAATWRFGVGPAVGGCLGVAMHVAVTGTGTVRALASEVMVARSLDAAVPPPIVGSAGPIAAPLSRQ